MSRHLGLFVLVLAALLSACETDGEYCWWEGCDGPEPSGPVPPPDPLSLDFDPGLYHPAGDIAVDGLFQLEVRTTSSKIPMIYDDTNAFSFEVTSSNNTTVEVDVFGDRVGEGSIFARFPNEAIEALPLSVRMLSRIDVAVDFDQMVDPPSDRVRILSDVRTLAILPVSEEGAALIDHSLAIDSTSAPGFTLSPWDALNVSAGVGTHRVSLTRASGELHQITVDVLERVDEIVAVDFVSAGQPTGQLCVRAEVGGARVHTTAWQFTGTNLELAPSTNGCAAFEGAGSGSSITVQVGGLSRTFTVVE